MTETVRRVRIALVDSGVEPSHPGVRGRAVLRGDAAALRDELGHGTWMAAAILAQSQDLELCVVKVLDALDHCEPERLLRGIDDALEFAPDLVNVSLGVTGLAWRAAFAELVARATARGARLVAPAALAGMPCWPGALDGVESVVADPNVPRVLPVQRVVDARRLWFASPTAPALRALPAPRARGESLATANVTGFLAALRTR